MLKDGNVTLLCVLQSGLTPLHLAAQEDKVTVTEVLAKHDANLDQQTKVQTCMCMINLTSIHKRKLLLVMKT